MTRHKLHRVSNYVAGDIYYNVIQAPFGQCLVAWQGEEHICHVSFMDHRELEEHLQFVRDIWSGCNLIHKQSTMIEQIFDDRREYQLLLRASDLQYTVWQSLLEIPCGQVVSYSKVAEMAGKSRAVRAVASAIGQNNMAYLIPCHRVVRKSGEIGQYRWNSERKRSMLLWESNTQ